MRCRPLVHFPAKESGLPLTKMPFLFLTQRRPRQPDDASFHFLTAGTRGGNCAGRHLKSLYRGSFSSLRAWRRNHGSTKPEKRVEEPGFPRNQRRVPQLSPATLKKGDRNVQSEPESRPAEPEPRAEAGSTAGRRAETRTAAAGSEPPGPKAGPGSLARSRVKARSISGRESVSK